MSLQPGTLFAGFTIERVLGAGGMGTVYLAGHPRLQRRVALKVLADTFTVDPKTRSAFDREATLAAKLDHPNIVSVYDRSAADDPALWLAMRYIDGGDAAALLNDHPDGLAPARAVRLLADAAHALDYAYAQGVLHRDVKPANLLIENDRRHGERAVLTDFGIARTLDDTVTLSGIAATFAYAAPERFSGAPADHRADIYSLGCTLFQLLTGQPPFPRKDQAAVVGAHLAAPPPAPHELRPELPAELDVVIATALAKAPHDRYPTCTALAEAAARAVAARPELPRPVAVSSGTVPDQAAVPTVVRLAGAPLRGPIDPSPPQSAEIIAESTADADSSARRRLALVSGLLLVGAGLAIGAALMVRGDPASSGTATSSTVVPQQVTSTAAPVTSSEQATSTPSPASIPPPDTSEQPARQSVPTYTVQRPSPPTVEAPQVVPQTRSRQWGG
ncbi:serine/threonine-protein kinase [Nocardia anaemiae]|uniref:serine/threonine-protein kinase n=1 Tax=Nocardia anaemiae TaxID=263910 RepID=UPI0007A4B364|nr:serine/threonine-protein kinase [Nocardia anaemiae]